MKLERRDRPTGLVMIAVQEEAKRAGAYGPERSLWWAREQGYIELNPARESDDENAVDRYTFTDKARELAEADLLDPERSKPIMRRYDEMKADGLL